MKNYLKLILVLLSTAFFSTSNADYGNRILICEGQDSFKVEGLYDFIEARENRTNKDFKTEATESDDNYEEILFKLIEKIGRKHPYLEKVFKTNLEFILNKNNQILNSQELALTSDSQSEPTFRICNDDKEAKLIQVSTFKSNTNKLHINQILFRRLNEESKAGLFFNQVIMLTSLKHKLSTTPIMGRGINAKIFVVGEINENSNLKHYFDSTFTAIFKEPIVKFEDRVFENWISSTNVQDANNYLMHAKTILPYDIEYKTSLTPQNLPPLQVAKLGRAKYQLDVDSSSMRISGVILTGSGYLFLGGLGVAILGSVDGGYPAIQAIAAAIVGTSVGGAVLAGGIAAGALTVVAVKNIKVKRVKNLILEAYNCKKNSYNCSGKEFKHIHKIYKKYANHYNNDELTFNEYIDRVNGMIISGELLGLSRREMQELINK